MHVSDTYRIAGYFWGVNFAIFASKSVRKFSAVLISADFKCPLILKNMYIKTNKMGKSGSEYGQILQNYYYHCAGVSNKWQRSHSSADNSLPAVDCLCLISFDVITVDSRYLEIEGTLLNTSRYPYFDISDL